MNDLADLRETAQEQLTADYAAYFGRGNAQDIIALIDEYEARQKEVAAEDIQDVIAVLEEFAFQKFDDGYEPCQISSGQVIDIVLPAIRAFLRPTAEECTHPHLKTCGDCDRRNCPLSPMVDRPTAEGVAEIDQAIALFDYEPGFAIGMSKDTKPLFDLVIKALKRMKAGDHP